MAIRIDFPELGAEQYVEIRDPKFLPWGTQKEISAFVADSMNKSAQMDIAETLAVALIKSGNILNEDGQAFTFPVSPQTVKTVPSIVVERVSEKFVELKKNPNTKN